MVKTFLSVIRSLREPVIDVGRNVCIRCISSKLHRVNENFNLSIDRPSVLSIGLTEYFLVIVVISIAISNASVAMENSSRTFRTVLRLFFILCRWRGFVGSGFTRSRR